MAKTDHDIAAGRPVADGDPALWPAAGADAARQAAITLYGTQAAVAAAWCALAARFDGREADYRFWLAIHIELRNGEQADGKREDGKRENGGAGPEAGGRRR